jgi:hypothetical protein
MSKEEAPVVYRYVAPDGRSYVGSVRHGQKRSVALARTNTRIRTALKDYPAATWFYEVLESFAPGCSDLALRVAEQRHIERLRTWMPEYGFNMCPTVAEIASSEQRAQFAADHKRACAETAKWMSEGSEEFWSQFSPEERAVMETQFRADFEQERAERRHKREVERWLSSRRASRNQHNNEAL